MHYCFCQATSRRPGHSLSAFLPAPAKWGCWKKIVFDNLEALADGGDPDGGAALAGWVAERHGNREDFEPTALEPGRRAQSAAGCLSARR